MAHYCKAIEDLVYFVRHRKSALLENQFEETDTVADDDDGDPTIRVNNNNSNKIGNKPVEAIVVHQYEDAKKSATGWIMDICTALVAFMFTFNAVMFYDTQHFHYTWIHVGTCVSHLYGGYAKRFYPNLTLNGVGMRGFYMSMIFGYGGNCLRWGLGWGLSGYYPLVGMFNYTFIFVAGIFVTCTMENTNAVIEGSNLARPIQDTFRPDLRFAVGELWCIFMELMTTVVFLCRQDLSALHSAPLILLAATANFCAWVALYLPAIIVVMQPRFGYYFPAISQRIFQFLMIIMLWAVDAFVRLNMESAMIANAKDDGASYGAASP